MFKRERILSYSSQWSVSICKVCSRITESYTIWKVKVSEKRWWLTWTFEQLLKGTKQLWHKASLNEIYDKGRVSIAIKHIHSHVDGIIEQMLLSQIYDNHYYPSQETFSSSYKFTSWTGIEKYQDMKVFFSTSVHSHTYVWYIITYTSEYICVTHVYKYRFNICFSHVINCETWVKLYMFEIHITF